MSYPTLAALAARLDETTGAYPASSFERWVLGQCVADLIETLDDVSPSSYLHECLAIAEKALVSWQARTDAA